MERKSVPRRLDIAELRHQLYLHSKYRAAIPRLKAYLKRSPDDLDALDLLMECYSRIPDWPSVLAWSDKILAIDQAKPNAWYERSKAFLSLGDREGAIASARTGLMYAEKLVEDDVDYAYLDEDQLIDALWTSLMAAGHYEEALAVAQSAPPPQNTQDTETWVICSLLALRRFPEAEALVAARWKDLAFCTWHIGILLGYQDQFEDALGYLRQRLAFISKPATRDFTYVCTHAECLALLGKVPMVEAILAYWDSQHLSRTRMQILKILHIVATSITNRPAAIQIIRDRKDAMPDRSVLREMRLSTTFEATDAIWNSLVTEALGSEHPIRGD